MSSSRTTPTSTTGSSASSSSRPNVIACGALAGHIRDIADRRGWELVVHSLPASLHNSPRAIAPAAERLALGLRASGARVALAYADCGSYGALDDLCERLNLVRLPGLHCYDVFAGPERIKAVFDTEPGTYLLTDFLVKSFAHSVLAPLGLDRHPELWADYFGHYRRLVWLTQSDPPSSDLAARAEAVAARFGLPLTVVQVGTGRLELELEKLIGGPARDEPHP
jgi:Protein of unknown function (DUF1638)